MRLEAKYNFDTILQFIILLQFISIFKIFADMKRRSASSSRGVNRIHEASTFSQGTSESNKIG